MARTPRKTSPVSSVLERLWKGHFQESGGFGTRHFFSGGFCRKVADLETATFLVADFQ
jgi:hypothetical protein